MSYEPLIEELVRLRHERGLSQAEVAKRLGLAQSHVSRWEKGGDLRLSTFVELARVLNAEPVLVPKEQLSVVRAILAETRRERDRPDDIDDRPRFG